MNEAKSIAKNTSVLMASQLTTWGLTLVLTFFLTRYLGPANMGKLYFATSVWAIIGIIVTFGTDTLLTKEIARRPERTGELFSTAIVLRVLLFALGYALVLAGLRLVNYPTSGLYVVAIIGVSTLVWQLGGVCQATLQGLEQMHYLAVANVVSKAVSTVVSIGLVLVGWDLYAIASVAALAGLVNLIIQFVYLRRLHALPFSLNPQAGRQMLRAGAPYFLTGVFLVAYMQIDIVVIRFLVSEEAVGWYGAADQLFSTLLFIPTVFMMAVFPVFSRMFTGSSSFGPNVSGSGDTLNRLLSKSFETLLLLSVPIGLGVMTIANPLVMLFGEKFAQSGPILAVLGIVLILTYQNMLLGQFLISIDRQNVWTVVMAVATLATIPLDLLFVPWAERALGNGAVGGAMAFVVTEALMMIVGFRLLPSGALNRGMIWRSARVLLAGLVMVAAVWPVRNMFIALPILTGAATYLGLILLLRLVSAQDVRLLRELGQGLLSRGQHAPVSVES